MTSKQEHVLHTWQANKSTCCTLVSYLTSSFPELWINKQNELSVDMFCLLSSFIYRSNKIIVFRRFDVAEVIVKVKMTDLSRCVTDIDICLWSHVSSFPGIYRVSLHIQSWLEIYNLIISIEVFQWTANLRCFFLQILLVGMTQIVKEQVKFKIQRINLSIWNYNSCTAL